MFDNVDLIINKKNTNFIKIWLLLVSLLMTIILSVSLFYEYKIIKKYQATVINQNNNYYLNVYLTDGELLKFNQKQMYIDDKLTYKKIVSISRDYVLTEFGKFRLITLETNIKNEDKINNNLLEIKLYERDTTIMKEVKNKLLGRKIYERT